MASQTFVDEQEKRRNCLGRICFRLQGSASDVDMQTSIRTIWLKMGDSTDDNIAISGSWGVLASYRGASTKVVVLFCSDLSR